MQIELSMAYMFVVVTNAGCEWTNANSITVSLLHLQASKQHLPTTSKEELVENLYTR